MKCTQFEKVNSYYEDLKVKQNTVVGVMLVVEIANIGQVRALREPKLCSLLVRGQ